MKLVRIGHTQRAITAFLLSHGRAANTYMLQTQLARTHSGYTKVVSRALWRLAARGIVKIAYNADSAAVLTASERGAYNAARQRNPRASMFWILAESEK